LKNHQSWRDRRFVIIYEKSIVMEQKLNNENFKAIVSPLAQEMAKAAISLQLSTFQE
jgi:hypothetical protein